MPYTALIFELVAIAAITITGCIALAAAIESRSTVAPAAADVVEGL